MNFEKLTDSLWKLQILGWSIYFVLMFLTYLSVDTPETILFILFIKVHRSIVGFLLTCLLWQVFRRTLDLENLGRNVFIILGFSMVSGIIWRASEVGFFSLVLDGYNMDSALQRSPRSALVYGVTVLAWSAIALGIQYWKQWQHEHENTMQALVLAEKAQLQMLRYQVNPHFLFNSMNSIRASIDEDQNRAKLMITQLSEFLRHSLLSGDKREIPLREELEAVKNYLAIEKIRFEDDLQIAYEVQDDSLDFDVPSFLLNPLVENAIKHGFKTSPRPLKVLISAEVVNDTLYIEVANTGHITDVHDSNGTQIGLDNVRERLERLFPERSTFELNETGEMVEAKITITKE